MHLEAALIVLAGALLVGTVSQVVARRTYRRYQGVRTQSGLLAGKLARALLDQQGLLHVLVRPAGAPLDDRYDPHSQSLYLSDPDDSSLAAAAVAAHEVGHALQHEEGHWSLALRRIIHPLGVVGAGLALGGLVVGWVLQHRELMAGSAWGYVSVIGLMLLALPVEVNANHRALALLAGGYLTWPAEWKGARRVLLAALLTYVGAAVIPLVHGWFALWSGRQA